VQVFCKSSYLISTIACSQISQASHKCIEKFLKQCDVLMINDRGIILIWYVLSTVTAIVQSILTTVVIKVFLVFVCGPLSVVAQP